MLWPWLNRIRSVRASLVGCLAFVPPAASTSESFPRREAPDKSHYTLFNPTPDTLMRELSADRPDKTDCPFTVDAGHVQVELDFANLTYNHSDSAGGKARTTVVGILPMNVKIGLLNSLDFQLVCTPYQLEKSENLDSGVVVRRARFDGLTPRLKVNLVGNDGGFFALAVIPFVTVPVGQGRPGDNPIEGGLGIPYSFDIANWDVGFQSTVRFNQDEIGAGYHTEFENSVSIGHTLIGKFSVAAEFFAGVSTERGAGWVGTVDTWLTWQASKNLRFDGGVYIGVTPAADDWHPWLGMTWRY